MLIPVILNIIHCLVLLERFRKLLMLLVRLVEMENRVWILLMRWIVRQDLTPGLGLGCVLSVMIIYSVILEELDFSFVRKGLIMMEVVVQLVLPERNVRLGILCRVLHACRGSS